MYGSGKSHMRIGVYSFSDVSSLKTQFFFYANFSDYRKAFIQHTTKLIKPQKKYWKSKCVRPLFMGRWVPPGSVLFTYHFRGEYGYLSSSFSIWKGKKSQYSKLFFSWPLLCIEKFSDGSGTYLKLDFWATGISQKMGF